MLRLFVSHIPWILLLWLCGLLWEGVLRWCQRGPSGSFAWRRWQDGVHMTCSAPCMHQKRLRAPVLETGGLPDTSIPPRRQLKMTLFSLPENNGRIGGPGREVDAIPTSPVVVKRKRERRGKRRGLDAGTMLVHCLRRWTNITPTSGWFQAGYGADHTAHYYLNVVSTELIPGPRITHFCLGGSHPCTNRHTAAPCGKMISDADRVLRREYSFGLVDPCKVQYHHDQFALFH